MNKKDLENLKPEARKIIREHLEKTGMSESALAKKANAHPAQLLLFMRGERGLTADTLTNIGRVINGKKPLKNN